MQLTLTLTITQVVKVSVTVNIQDYVHPDDHTLPTYTLILVVKNWPYFVLD